MAKVVNPQLRELLLQSHFSPEKQRLMQLDACETLIRLIKPHHKYPFDFICFHITGYKSQSHHTAQTIPYNQLIHDLPAYSEQLSRSMKIAYRPDNHQKIYTLDSLAKKFRVCKKTISRWRKKGLTGRYLVFPDNRQRLCFTAATVDFYITNCRKKTNKNYGFSRLSLQQRQAITRRLLRWSQLCPQHRQEAIRRTARKFGCSFETVRSILIAAEKSGPENRPVIAFTPRHTVISAELRKQVYQLYSQAVPVAELVSRFKCSKSAIYQAINAEKAAQVAGLSIEYIDSPDFHGRETSFLTDNPDLLPQALTENNNVFPMDTRPATNPNHDQQWQQLAGSTVLKNISAYIKDIYKNKPLTTLQEQLFFKEYNFLKYQAAQLQKQLSDCSSYVSATLIRKIRSKLIEAQKIQHYLILSNLRLVISVARKHSRNDTDMLDLISDGNISLMRAVEKFDYTRHIKFSTYASWAIIKRFATLRRNQNRYQQHEFSAEENLLELAHDLRVTPGTVLARENAHKSLQQTIAETLEDRERYIVQQHFGLTPKTEIIGQRKPKSLAQIASVIGLSKERVRQIELKALQKLRYVLQPDQFDLLTQS